MSELILVMSVIIVTTIVWAVMFIHQDLDNIRKEIKKVVKE